MLIYHRYRVLRDCGFKITLTRHDKNNLEIYVTFPSGLSYPVKNLILNISRDKKSGMYWAGSDLHLASPSFHFNYHHYAHALIYRFSEVLFQELKKFERDFYFDVITKHSSYQLKK